MRNGRTRIWVFLGIVGLVMMTAVVTACSDSDPVLDPNQSTVTVMGASQ